MKKVLSVVLALAMMIVGFAFAESPATAVTADTTAVVIGEEATAIEAEMAAAGDLSAYFGVDVGDKQVVACTTITVAADATEAFKAVFTLATPVAEGAVAMLGLTTGGVTTWTEMESAVADGKIEVVFTDAMIAAAHAADSTTLVILQ